MYSFLLAAHSIFRWIVLASLLLAIFRSCHALLKEQPFTKADNALRHWTATIAHIQLILGIVVYEKSPFTRYYWNNGGDGDLFFFSIIHATAMVISIVVITVGSALAKRKLTDREKFQTILVWFVIALVLIFMAIPWPFSPLAGRPYFRPF
jgi:hypothetical protein